jgi:hypothetical protein
MTDEVAADDLEAYRASGNGVYDLLLGLERRREQLLLDGGSIWTADAGVHAVALSTWCAYALQTLGDQFLQAAYDVDPAPRGYVPALIRDQALAFYRGTEAWVLRAREAGANPGYRLLVRLPDHLPAWVEPDLCPPEHLPALLASASALREKAAAMLVDLERGVPDEHLPRRDRVRQLYERATARTGLVLGLGERPGVSEELRRHMESGLQAAIQEYYEVGQLSAMPRLISGYLDAGAPASKRRRR